MKYLKYSYIPVFILILYFVSCSDDTSTGNGNYNVVDPTITITDEFGNVLGGDTTDWCQHGGNGVIFHPAYPNPTTDTFNLHFVLAQSDTLTLYFLNSPTDTLFFLKDDAKSAGIYDFHFSSDAIGFNNIIKRLYLKVKVHPNSDPYCRYYGDIQFY